MIEPLESRIAPAAIFHYTDIDGDLVTIKANKAAPESFSLPGVLTFTNTDAGVPRQLQKIDLSVATGNAFAGSDLILTVKRGPAGDGFANVGAIDARSTDGGVDLDLGTVSIAGDLGQIDAGDGDTSAASPAIKALKVRTMGLFGLATQAGAGSFDSDIQGRLGSFTATETVQDVFLHVTGGTDGTIGSVTIGGSLLGLRVGNLVTLPGAIKASGDIGPVKIKGDVLGLSYGGGSIQSDGGKIASVTIGGSLLGLAGDFSGLIRSGGDLGPVKIVHDVRGGTGPNSGYIANDATAGPLDSAMGSITIGGTLVGGSGAEGGQIRSEGTIGAVKIGHDLKAGDGDDTGSIYAGSDVKSLSIGGSIIGGRGNESGSGGNLRFGQVEIFGAVKSITVRGSLVGGDDPDLTDMTSFASFSACISASGSVHSLKIGGSIIGGSGNRAGAIFSGSYGTLSIGGSIIGGMGDSTGDVQVTAIGTLKIAGDLQRPAGNNLFSNGQVSAQTFGNLTIGGSVSGVITGSQAGTIKIGGDLDGTGGSSHGFLDFSSGFDGVNIKSLRIGGSVIGGSANSGLVSFSGFIRAGSEVSSIKIGGDLLGGSVTGSASLFTSGSVEIAGRLGAVAIGGSIVAGTDTSSSSISESAGIYSYADIGSVTVRGDLIGNASGKGARVTIAARGLRFDDPRLVNGPDVAIGKISIGGRAEYALLLGGFTPSISLPQGANADAQIGAVKVGGDWIASSIVAGIENYGANATKGATFPDADDNTYFGDGNDHRISGSDVKDDDDIKFISKIGSILIKGAVVGTSATGDHFGFVAQQIGSFKAGGFTASLNSATDDSFALSHETGDDVTFREG